MRCQPNDLAVIISLPRGISPPSLERAMREQVLGAVVRVVNVTRGNNGAPVWRIEREIVVDFGASSPLKVWGIADHDLQPIRGTHAPTDVQQPEELTA